MRDGRGDGLEPVGPARRVGVLYKLPNDADMLPNEVEVPRDNTVLEGRWTK